MFNKCIILMSVLCAATAANANNSVVTVNDPATSSGYQASYYVNPDVTSPETHIIGVYETRSDHSGGYHPTGTAYVHVTGSSEAPVNLVLSSYEPTAWILDGEGLSFIQSVTVNSYYASTAAGIDSSKVQITKLGNYGYAWPSSSGGSNTPALVSTVEALYGAPIATFSGAYRATDFSVVLSPVPEPGTASLLLLGLGGGIFVAYNKKTSARRKT
jgi:hypothetical protein